MIIYISIPQGLLDHNWEELELVYRTLQNPQPEPGALCVLLDPKMDKTPLTSLHIWWLTPQFLQRHFCLWMPDFIVDEWNTNKRHLMPRWFWLYCLYTYFNFIFYKQHICKFYLASVPSFLFVHLFITGGSISFICISIINMYDLISLLFCSILSVLFDFPYYTIF